MTDPAPVPLVSLLTEVEEPRRPQARRHSLEAVICGADNWTAVEFFGHQKQAWLEAFLELPHSSPSHDQTRGVSPLHLVSAWADEARLVLGQRRVDDRSNEITANPELLKTLALEGSLVTIDRVPSGWGCRKRIAQTLRDRFDSHQRNKNSNPQTHNHNSGEHVYRIARRQPDRTGPSAYCGAGSDAIRCLRLQVWPVDDVRLP